MMSTRKVYLYEQLPNYTFFPQPLAVPNARDYVATERWTSCMTPITHSTPLARPLMMIRTLVKQTLRELLFSGHDPLWVIGMEMVM